MAHICFSKLTIIGSDNGLSPSRCQAIMWCSAGMLLIWNLAVKSWTKFIHVHIRKCIWKCCLRNCDNFAWISRCYHRTYFITWCVINVFGEDKCPKGIAQHVLKICSFVDILTHWGRDEMDISETTFSNVFSSIKMFEFRLQFYWSLFLRDQLTIFQHWFS